MHDIELIKHWIERRARRPNFVGLVLLFDFLQADMVFRLEGRTGHASEVEISEHLVTSSWSRTAPRGALGTNKGFPRNIWHFLRSAMMVKCDSIPYGQVDRAFKD